MLLFAYTGWYASDLHLSNVCLEICTVDIGDRAAVIDYLIDRKLTGSFRISWFQLL